ncbi:cobalt-precorrin-5B (C(1))-methyltransferase CbiD [Furfurilactobacillus rossiae]|uniref:Cobalt-precorrin-5B C(1)-methyltransferase n=1 Tax=Furfurilactobacillus rossiae DSM 15814 TaxID=1114972 RepID=A0A0R1RSR0_9LACO|nr:cobalt-precorrin-5B (C(1))-methyltransferase CbiD [Furfurilactobacillus rossiae]KRL56168.1 cobalt-precorrin-6A synthase [Furfurilactobacillus rossiae DSM 15814]MCF6165857.1 cobalt-precorrin-5B (C(1))-methyltransferase CbiD [Furfurilactobacillus rossiae]QFR66189.1 cobalt-precorrin-5B (C(1))-methyltransferase [Furfurilactobacillus rossiae]QLE61625.1 Cobalt-precorrin-6 synthase anaerobic [Furfurilactobacillus rossiae]QLE64422.1 Cobalt-precorrin-6 synthase anaerobic [Furfurilactobacillus rossia
MSEDDYVYYNGKRLRKGFTTGTTATAAAVAATKSILQQEAQTVITVLAANGQKATFEVESCEFDKKTATVAITKDGGDDQDATDGMLIYAKVTLRDDNQITLDGGKGIGRVTEKGLANDPGMPAINPTPRKMIKKSVRETLGEDHGADIVIFAPEGERVAKLTYNPKLGIVGGISILGTSGIVTPMSEESWKHSISIEMNIHRQRGDERIILTPGDYGEDFLTQTLKISNKQQVQMSNFVGYVLKETQRLGFKHVLIVGDLGKMIKVAGGIFSTHSKDADARAEIMVANLALLGAPTDLLKQVYDCLTTISMIELVNKAGYQQVYQVLVDKIKGRCEKLLNRGEQKTVVDAVIFSKMTGYLASTEPLDEIEKVWR